MSERGPGGINALLWEAAAAATVVVAGAAVIVAPSVLKPIRAKFDSISGKTKLKEEWQRTQAALAETIEAKEWAERQMILASERNIELERTIHTFIGKIDMLQRTKLSLEEQLEAAVRRGKALEDKLQLEESTRYNSERLAERRRISSQVKQLRAEDRIRAYRLQGHLQDMKHAVEGARRDVMAAKVLQRGRYAHERLGERQRFVFAQQRSWAARRLCKAHHLQKHLQLLKEAMQSTWRAESLAMIREARMETQRLYMALGVAVFVGTVAGYCLYLTHVLNANAASGLRTVEGGSDGQALFSGITDVPPQSEWKQGGTCHTGGAGLAAHRGPVLQVRLRGEALGQEEGPFHVRTRGRWAAEGGGSRRRGRSGRQGGYLAPPQHHT